MTDAALVGLILVVALLGVLVAGLLRSHAEVLRALHDLGINLDPDEAEAGAPVAAIPGRRGPTGAQAADISGTTPSGGAAHVAIVGSRAPTLLAFLSSTCLTCRTFWEELADPEVAAPDGARVVIVTQGEDGESPAAVARLAPKSVTTVMSTDAWITYDVPGAPYFVLVDPSGDIRGEGAATTWPRVLDLLGRAQADAVHLGQRDRELLVDEVLRRSGIGPDDPSVRGAGDPA